MSYPRQVDKFIPWTKAMVAGATLDKPHYPGTRAPMKASKNRKRGSRRRRKKQNGSKD